MILTRRKLSYILLPIAIALHVISLVLAGPMGIKLLIAGGIVLIISIRLNLTSPGGKREELYWVPAIGCIFLFLFALFMHVIGFAIISVYFDFVG